ncbi:hypothetical protein JRO89_XS12G0054600 [Xanthoceras sorbifolium]|uniref:Uncharacterized protein n=1 Tax=Xanthoceras sorbifolium TaxID=99658 RepID=A0ABQ8HB95_9ROSI|nr:hypothetical protein JRO89_XS12G0054600 [Xanthoceras sorbifolium]
MELCRLPFAAEFGDQSNNFPTLSDYGLIYLCVPKLEEREFPFGDDDMDKKIAGLAGMDGFLRRGDLPVVCVVNAIGRPNT